MPTASYAVQPQSWPRAGLTSIKQTASRLSFVLGDYELLRVHDPGYNVGS